MGRRERPLDPSAGPAELFAFELRKLRDSAGITYRRLAAGSGYSVTTLSQAAAGHALPSLPVLEAYVRGCGGEVAEWTRRWREASDELARDRTGDGPYQGLARYEPGDRDRFFGRDAMLARLLAATAERRLTVLVGASGCGKSSLLRAGLVATLQRAGPDRRPAAIRILTPGPEPVRAHRAALAPAAGDGDTWILVDQFEELFTVCGDEAVRARFVELLLAALEPASRLRVVLAVRADFYGRCAEHAGLAAALDGASLLVAPLTTDELRAVVTGPAQAAGLIVERALTDRICADAHGEPGSLPLVSHALRETWRRHRGRHLTVADYRASGGVRGALAATADRCYDGLPGPYRALAREVLLRLVAPGDDGPDTRRPVPAAELGTAESAARAEVVDRLAAARLITLHADTVELAHEALIDAWPRLHDWVAADRARLRTHRQLTAAARTWRRLGDDPGALYRGERLRAASAELDPGALNRTERAFLTASLAARAAERRAARRTRVLVAAVSVTVLAAAVLGVGAWRQHRADVRRDAAVAARHAARVADERRAADPRTAALLSVAAWRTADTAETRAALLDSWYRPERDGFAVPGAGGDPELSADGGTVLAGGTRAVAGWRVGDHRRRGTLRPPPGYAAGGVAVAPDGRAVVLAGRDGLRRWSFGARRPGARFGPAGARVRGFSGAAVTVTVPSGAVEAWDPVRRAMLFRRPVSEVDDPDVLLALSPDRRYAAVCPGERGRLQVWDVRRHRRLPVPHRASGSCRGAEVGFGGGHALAVATDSGIEAWDPATGRDLLRQRGSDLHAVAFGTDGRYLAAASGTRTVLVWRVDAPRHPVARLTTTGSADDLAVDGRTLRYLDRSAGVVHTVALTDLAGRWRDAANARAVLDPTGTWVATADGRGHVEVRDARSGTVVDRPAAPPAPAGTGGDALADLGSGAISESDLLAFGPGRRLAYGVSSADATHHSHRVLIRDPLRHKVSARLDLTDARQPALGVVAVRFAGPDVLVAVRADDTVERWRIGTGRRIDSRPGRGLAAVSGDGRLLATGDGRIVPTGSGGTVVRFTAADATSLAFGPHASYLAVGDAAGHVALWDAGTGRRVARFAGVDGEAVAAQAFSPDGRTLAVAGEGGALRLVDVASGQPLGAASLDGSRDPLLDLRFTPNGRDLTAAGSHAPVHRYPVAAATLAAALCRAGPTRLPRAEWSRALPAVPYRDPC